MGLHIENEADRCLNCKKPMCQQHCPINTPIPHTLDGPVFCNSILDDDGFVIGQEKDEKLIPADSVIMAVSQGSKNNSGACSGRGKKGGKSNDRVYGITGMLIYLTAGQIQRKLVSAEKMQHMSEDRMEMDTHESCNSN